MYELMRGVRKRGKATRGWESASWPGHEQGVLDAGRNVGLQASRWMTRACVDEYVQWRRVAA